MEDWGHHIEAVASALLGKPTSRKGRELRYGHNGSLKINLESGWWDDWESGEGGKGRGGGVLALIKREKGLDKADAIAWMRDTLGLDVGQGRHVAAQKHREEPPPAEPPEDREIDSNPQPKSKIVKVYDYVDHDSTLLFQVCRMEPKTFLQRRKPRPDDNPEDIKVGWVWKRDGVEQVPYRLPELMEAIVDERLICLCEGERDVDNLVRLGVPATTNAGGAGKWPEELTPYFAGADVIILPDNDPQTKNTKTDELLWHPDGRPKLPGQDHARMVAAKLVDVARCVRILSLPNLPPKGDATDWIEAGGTSAKLYDLVDKHAVSPAEYQIELDKLFPLKPFVSKFGVVIWGEPRAVRETYDYLIKPLIPRRESVLIYGASQSGKSFLTHDMAMAIARGGDRYCGMKVRRGGVVYCAPEAGGGFADLRMPAYSLGKGVPLLGNPLPFACLTKKFDLFGDEKQLINLIAEIAQIKAKFAAMGVKLEVVVIDTLNKVTPAMDEISGKDVGIVMGRLDRIKTELDTGLWLVHHKNAAGTGPRGHTSLYAAFETAIEVGRTGQIFPAPITDALGKPIIFSDGVVRNVAREERQTIVQKQREGEDGRKSKFYLRPLPIGRDDDGDERYSCVVEWLDKDQAPKSDGAKAAEEDKARAEERMTEQRRAIFRALKKAITDYGVVPPAALGLPQSITMVVDKEYWAKTWTSQTMEQNPGTARKALARTNLWLLNQGYIGRDGDWAWVTDNGTKRQAAAEPADNVVQFPSGVPTSRPDEPAPDWSDDNLGEPA